MDAIHEASAERGYLLLPWPRGGDFPPESVALRLHNAWWRYCDQRRLPFLEVSVRRNDDRAMLHYDLICLSPQECDGVALADRLHALFDTYAPERERWLCRPRWDGVELTFWVGRDSGWVRFDTRDPRPLELTRDALRDLVHQDEAARRWEAWKAARREQQERARAEQRAQYLPLLRPPRRPEHRSALPERERQEHPENPLRLPTRNEQTT